MALDVKVKIDLAKPTGRPGSWFPLIYGNKTGDEGLDTEALGDFVYGEFRNLEELRDAGFVKSDGESGTVTESAVYKAAKIMLTQDDIPEKFAVGLYEETPTADGIDDLRKMGGWRQTVMPGATTEVWKAVAEHYETVKDRMLFAQISGEIKSLKTTIDGLKLTGYDYTNIWYYPDESVYLAAAVVGATAGLKAGGFTYKNMIIKGVPPLDLSDTEIETIHAAGAQSLVTKAGDIVTTEGKTVGGEYIDVVDGLDYTIQNIAYRSQKVLNNSPKVPYDNNGIAMLESATLGALKDAWNNGIIAVGEDGKPAYSTSFVLREQTSPDDRLVRKYPYGSFSFDLAGAIHEATIIGEAVI